MTVIPGLAPVAPPVSIETSADRDTLTGVEWNENGVSFIPRGCLPVNLADAVCVECDDQTADRGICSHTFPDAVTFKPFWVGIGATACVQDSIDYLGEIRGDLGLRRSAQIARALHSGASGSPGLATVSIALNDGGNAASPSEALAILLDNAGTAGLTGGVFIGPAYALPSLIESRQVALTGSTYTTTLGLPFIFDMGLPVTGPNGADAPDGTAWIYWTPSRPVVAINERIDPQGESDALAFFDHSTGCYTPYARQRAIVAFNPCHTYAVLVDVRSCTPCEPVPVPEIPAP